MSSYPNPFSTQRPGTLDYATGSGVVARFMNNVYAWMCAGLATTAAVAWWVSTQPQLMRQIFHGGTFFVLVIAELALVFSISYAVNKITAGVATALFLLYSALNGLTLSAIFVVYSLPSVAAAFIVTAAMFGAMSLIGFVTKKDLTSI